MAATNGYTPEQASDLYIADGTIDDWLWGQHKIFGYTFEMYPRTSSPGFYPPDEVDPGRRPRATARPCCSCWRTPTARTAVIGKEAQYCGTARPRTIYSDDFETATRLDGHRDGTDTATIGRFERGDPAATSSSGAKQLGTTVSGVNDLVTGRRPAPRRATNDVDGGVTTITSPAITLTGGTTYTLSFSVLPGARHERLDRRLPARAGAVRLDLDGRLPGSSARRPTSTAPGRGTASLSAFAGQTVQIVVEAADAVRRRASSRPASTTCG